MSRVQELTNGDWTQVIIISLGLIGRRGPYPTALAGLIMVIAFMDIMCPLQVTSICVAQVLTVIWMDTAGIPSACMQLYAKAKHHL